MEQFQQLQELMSSLEIELKKFYEKGFASAGTRARKICQDIKSKCQDLRNDIQDKKKDKNSDDD